MWKTGRSGREEKQGAQCKTLTKPGQWEWREVPLSCVAQGPGQSIASLFFQWELPHRLAPPGSLDGSCSIPYYARSSSTTPLTGPPTSLHFYSVLIAFAHVVPSAQNVFPPQCCLSNSYSSFKAQVKYHLPCDAFLYCPRLIPIPAVIP